MLPPKGRLLLSSREVFKIQLGRAQIDNAPLIASDFNYQRLASDFRSRSACRPVSRTSQTSRFQAPSCVENLADDEMMRALSPTLRIGSQPVRTRVVPDHRRSFNNKTKETSSLRRARGDTAANTRLVPRSARRRRLTTAGSRALCNVQRVDAGGLTVLQLLVIRWPARSFLTKGMESTSEAFTAPL